VCSSPLKFKGKPWEIYEHSGCDNDKTDVADPVEIIANISHTSSHKRVTKYEYQPTPHSSPRRENYTSSDKRAAKYIDQPVPYSSSRREQVQVVRTDSNYFRISIALAVVFLGLLAGAVYLWWCGVRPHKLRRYSPVHSDAETPPPSSSTT